MIPHTLKLTNLSNLKKNTTVNIEFDILSKYKKIYFMKKLKFNSIETIISDAKKGKIHFS